MRALSRRSLIGTHLGLIALTVAAITSTSAQEDPSKYPTRPIHIIVGFAAGGGNDIIARIFGQKLSESLGQPVIIENKPGGGAIVATEYVARSTPDGYTLLVGASGMAINPALYARLPYDFDPRFRCRLRTRIVSAVPDCQRFLADQVGRRSRDLCQGQSGQDELRQLIRLIPTRHRTVQAKDRRTDAGHSLQECKRICLGGGVGSGDRNHCGRRSSVEPGQERAGPRARGRDTKTNRRPPERSDHEGSRCRCRRSALERRLRAKGNAARDRQEA